MTKSKEQISTDFEKADKLAKEAMQLRVQSCSDEIQQVLAKYKCTFKPIFIFDGTQMKSFVNIVPVSQQNSPVTKINAGFNGS